MSWRDMERARITSGGSTVKQQYLNEMIDFMDESFFFASDVDTVLHESSTPNVYNEVVARVVAKVKNSSLVTDFERKLIFRDPFYVVNLGDHFKFEGKTWIVKSTHTNTIPKSCELTWCNNVANIVDDNGTVYEIPCNIKNRLNELERDGYLRIPDNRLEMTIQYSPQILSMFRYAPIWTRLLFNGQAYRVEAIDSVTNVDGNGNGYMTVLMKSDLISPYDDVENNIADRFKPKNISIQINNGPYFELQVGDTTQLTVSVMQDNEIITNPSVTYKSENPDIATVDVNGLITPVSEGSVTITVEYGGVFAQTVVEVVAVIEDSFSIIIEGSDSIVFGRDQTYIGKVLNNGIEVHDKTIEWNLTDISGLDTDLANIAPQENSVKVIANDDEELGTVKLLATLSTDSNVTSQKQIKIRGLF